MTETKFAKYVVILNGAVPLALLGFDAWHHRLGANPINYALTTTGLLSLIFLCLTLLVTPARKLTGWNWLITFRRSLGLYAFFYASIHFSIFFVLDRSLSVSSTLSEIVQRVYLWFGITALVLMIPLAVTSTNGMIQRIGAKRWQALHRLIYVAVIAGAIHYYMQSKSDKRQPTAFLMAIGILLAYRLVAHYLRLRSDSRKLRANPAANAAKAGAVQAKPKFWSGRLRVARVFDETPNVRTFRLAPPDGGDLPFAYLPGQYLNLSLVIDGTTVRRSFTMASSPTRAGHCELTVKREEPGIASHHLHANIHEGALLNVSAPAGRFTFTGTEAGGIVLIGGGVGITPLMSVIRYLTDRSWPGDIFLVYSARVEDDLIFRQELQFLAHRFPNLHLTLVLTRADGANWAGPRGRITSAFLNQTIPHLADRLVHLCGPTAMMAPVKQMLREAGVPEDKIKTEVFESRRVHSPVSANSLSMENAALPATSNASNTKASLPAPEPDATDAAGDSALTDPAGPLVTFALSRKSLRVPPGTTLLEASETAGVNINFECRSGICGTCKTKLLGGHVEMEARDALDPSDEAQNIILACQAMPLDDVTLNA